MIEDFMNMLIIKDKTCLAFFQVVNYQNYQSANYNNIAVNTKVPYCLEFQQHSTTDIQRG
jgi:hypothetical protein